MSTYSANDFDAFDLEIKLREIFHKEFKMPVLTTIGKDIKLCNKSLNKHQMKINEFDKESKFIKF